MKLLQSKGPLACSVMMGTIAILKYTSLAPQSWGCIAFSIWLLFAISKGWSSMQTADKNLLAWGWLSVAAFNCFTRADPSFRVTVFWHNKGFFHGIALQSFTLNCMIELMETYSCLHQTVLLWGVSSHKAETFFVRLMSILTQGWGDVYYFCGSRLEYCACDMRWNYEGWIKAFILWNFVLSVSVGLQKLAIQAGLKGLLPGEPEDRDLSSISSSPVSDTSTGLCAKCTPRNLQIPHSLASSLPLAHRCNLSYTLEFCIMYVNTLRPSRISFQLALSSSLVFLQIGTLACHESAVEQA